MTIDEVRDFVAKYNAVEKQLATLRNTLEAVKAVPETATIACATKSLSGYRSTNPKFHEATLKVLERELTELEAAKAAYDREMADWDGGWV